MAILGACAKPLALQGLLYILVGLSGLCIDALIYFILRSWGVQSIVLANVIARHFGAVYTFTGNKVITFKSRSRDGSTLIKQMLFYIALLYFSIFLSSTLLHTLVTLLKLTSATNETAVKIFVDVFCALVNFFICKYIIFKK